MCFASFLLNIFECKCFNKNEFLHAPTSQSQSFISAVETIPIFERKDIIISYILMISNLLAAPSPADSMEVVHSPCDSGLTDHNGVSQMTPISFQGLQDEDSIGSPPVDERSLHETLARNREKLKVKLLTRRPIHQLVQQGIIPREYIGQYSSKG